MLPLTCHSLLPQVSKLVEDISRLQAALSGVKEATAAQMHAMEEQLEEKNRLIQRLELKLQDSSLDEAKRDLQWVFPLVFVAVTRPVFCHVAVGSGLAWCDAIVHWILKSEYSVLTMK